ncbi:MAG: cell envelope integrity protein TolA [Pseudomonadales bacterium]
MTTSLYAKPVMPRIILRPALVTLLIHGLLLYLLTANWEPTPPQQSNRDAFAAIVRDELTTAAAQQQTTVTAGEISASFVSLIQRTVVNYWSRPPSARNGMECELSIQLIPTGEVVNVTLVRSSGNSAFDSSAINAVQKAGAFPELQNLPSREFEKNFRRLTLIFKPEDLRY